MNRKALTTLLSALLFACSVALNSFQLTDVASSNDLGFVIGTCWLQVYEPNPDERMEAMMIDLKELNEIHEEWRQVWKNDR